MFFHLANRAKNQKLRFAIHAQPSHEYDSPMEFSTSSDFVFLPTLIHSLSLRHCFFSFRICAENTKGPIKLGLSKSCLDTLLPRSNYTKIALHKSLKRTKTSRFKRKDRNFGSDFLAFLDDFFDALIDGKPPQRLIRFPQRWGRSSVG
jgi:hypothetical protein